MWFENIDIWALSEWEWQKQEVSEQAQEQAKKQSSWAFRAHQEVIKNQKHNYTFALFLSKVLSRYFSSEKIIWELFELVKNFEKNKNDIVYIFSPFVNWKSFSSLSDFLSYINEKNLTQYKNLLWYIAEFEKLWWDDFWYTLKNGKSKVSYDDIKNEFLNNIK